MFTVSNAGLTYVASTGPQTITTPTFTANYTEWVYSAPVVFSPSTPALCGGCLNFFIELTDVSGDSLDSITTGSFGAFNTAVGYSTAGLPGTPPIPAPTPSSTVITPSSVNRNPGSVIGFSFQPTVIAAGDGTVLLEIETNATNYTAGYVSAQDDTAGTSAGFAPTSAPEPGTMAMLGLGLIGLGMAKVNRSKKSA
jgi:hypothetical protein